MIHWSWLIPAVVFGLVLGFLMCGILGGTDDDPK